MLLSPFAKLPEDNFNYLNVKQASNINDRTNNFLNQKRSREDINYNMNNISVNNLNSNYLTFSPGINFASSCLKPMTPLISSSLPKSANIQPVFMFDSMLNPFQSTPIISKNGTNFPQFYSFNYGMDPELIISSDTETVNTPASKDNIIMVKTPINNSNFYSCFPYDNNIINSGNNINNINSNQEHQLNLKKQNEKKKGKK